MPNEQDITEHKLIISCPVALNPDIFTKINGSIEALERTIIGIEKRTATTEVVANKAKKKVDYLYWFFGTFAGVIIFGVTIFKLFYGG